MATLKWFCGAIAALTMVGASARMVHAIDVDIVTPAEGATVAGVVTITGTATDLGDGQVAVSIDGGPFQIAPGGAAWALVWDTTGLTDGAHTIRARARECIGCPVAFDLHTVVVANHDNVSVAITAPSDGAVVNDTLIVSGVSSGAVSVALAVDDGAFQPTNGVDAWNVVFEPGALELGAHTVTARATSEAGTEMFDTIGITVESSGGAVQDVVYTSSVDGTPLTGVMYVPDVIDGTELVPLVCHLHGGGGTGRISADMQAQLDARGWIGIAPDGRAWGLAQLGCTWQNSAAYVDRDDPNVGPGETDIFDMIEWAVAHWPIDPDRIYLTGFSMGGRGTYMIGLKHPDRFAAIAPMGPASDMYEILARRPEPCVCKEGMTGGLPDDSPMVRTMYTVTSPRFLLENAYNVPVFHAHGTLDGIAANNRNGMTAFWHGWHMINEYWDAAHVTAATVDEWGNSCFDGNDDDLPFIYDGGHTPTLSELSARHPEAYDWAYLFTPVGHVTDERWLTGTSEGDGIFGTPDPAQPGELIGIYDFFAARTRVHSPDSIVYKSYTDVDRHAYWLTLDVADPWSNVPGAVRAVRESASNGVVLELVRATQLTVDVEHAMLDLSEGATLSIVVAVLDEPVFDPALAPVAGAERTTLRFVTALPDDARLHVWRDGVRVPPGAVVADAGGVSIGPFNFDAPTEFVIRHILPGDANGDGVVGLADLVSVLASWGTCPAPPVACPADFDGNAVVDLDDLLDVLAGWTG